MINILLLTILTAFSYILARILFSSETKHPLFKGFGSVAAIIILLSYLFSYIGIPLNLISYNVALALFSLAGVSIIYFRERSIPFDKLIPKCTRTQTVLLAVFVLSQILGFFYFQGDLSLPQYFSPDPAVHFLMGLKVHDQQELLLTSQSIYFPDSEHINIYPFGTSALLAVLNEGLDLVDSLSLFNFVNVLLYALVTTYFIAVMQDKMRIRSRIVKLTACALIVLGLFFNLIIMGFTSQLLGLFFLILFFDLYTSNIERKPLGMLLPSLALISVFFTYFYWIPIAVLFIAIQNLDLIDPRKWKGSKNRFVNLAVLSLATSMTVLPYFYLISTNGMLAAGSSDGTAYKVFLLNFVFVLPFLITFTVGNFRNYVSNRNYGITFGIAAVLYTLVLGLLFMTNNVSAYTFAKSFYFTIPILLFIGMKGVDEIAEKLEGETSRKAFILGFSGIILLAIVTPFIFKNEHYTPATTRSLGMNTYSLHGRIFDAFYFNGQNFHNPSIHQYSLTEDERTFFSNIHDYLPEDTTRISAVSHPHNCLWFYTLTDIWPRDLEEAQDLFEPAIVDLQIWINEESSKYIVLLEGTTTKDWIEKNDYKDEEFTIVYQEGENLLVSKN